MTGYTAKEMVGKSIFTVLVKKPEEEVTDIMTNIQKGEGVTNFPSTITTKSGQKRDINLTVSSIVDEDNRIIGISLIGRVI